MVVLERVVFPYVSGEFMYSRRQGWDRELGSQIAGGPYPNALQSMWTFS